MSDYPLRECSRYHSAKASLLRMRAAKQLTVQRVQADEREAAMHEHWAQACLEAEPRPMEEANE
jgi:hypothetical protein